ncbi:MAG: sugar phosphate isomerase/epimerase family protein [Chloroflexota bacterium]
MAQPFKRDILMCPVQFERELKAGSLSILDMAAIAARFGLQGVEYREVYWRDKASELPAVRDQAAGLGLKLAYATYTPLVSRDPARQRQLLVDLEDARALGAPFLRVFRGERADVPEDAAEVRRLVQPALARAGELGLRLALENHFSVLGSQLSDVLRVLEQLDSPLLGVNVDIANYVVNGQDPLAAIEQLSPWVMYAHLKDVREGPEGLQQTYLGNGRLDYGALLAALDATGRDFPLCLEFNGAGDPEGALSKSLAYLAALR